ncbi:MAG: 3',5'-cyclic-nucleotide phosphodiesterase [Sulfuricellaceae bacterium]|nr:3',5'-cyclic-nucleotide phosphodiesterase [Sulfuricellaceae bacterium]
MRLRILGCSGGIVAGQHTTSMLLDDDILIDAGTGVGTLTLEQMTAIDHVFLSHSHLDHSGFIPFLLDSVAARRTHPLTVFALPETIQILKDHMFNWKLWPDFSQIPSPASPWLRYQPILLGETVELNGRKITALPARHVVPTIGYLLDSGSASLAFSADTIDCAEFWDALNRVENLKTLIIETSFTNAENGIAYASKHYYPSLLAEQLQKLSKPVEVYITHLEPGEQDAIMSEIHACVTGLHPIRLNHGHIFEF